MKQKFLYIIMMIAALTGWNSEAWGATTSYVLNDTSPHTLDGIDDTGFTLNLSGPGQTLTFVARHNSFIGEAYDYMHIEATKSDGSKVEIYSTGDRAFTTKDKTYTVSNLDHTITSIRFYTTFGATLKKYISNIKVTRATLLKNFPYSTTSPFDMSSLKYGRTTTIDITNITYHNTTYPQNLTGTCTWDSGTEAGTFSIGTVQASLATGTINIPVTFSPQSPGAKSATVTLKLGSTIVATFKVTGTGADKGTPAFNWNVTNAYKNHSYSDFFNSTNTDTEYTITSSNPDLGNVVGGKLVFYDGEGTIRFTVSQAGNDDWHAHEETFEVEVTEAQNHLPLTITSNNYSKLVRSISGSFTWVSNGIRLGDGGGGLNYNDKLAEINFEGIPDKISFDYEKQAAGATDIDWYVIASVDGNNWTEIWSVNNSGSGHVDITIENANVRYVRLCYSGNFGGYFRNITITERRYLTANVDRLEFGEKMKGNGVDKTFTLSHCNAGYGLTISSSDPNFIATPNPVTTTGGDIMGTETITVRYLNNTLGYHGGTLTISDPTGKTQDVTISVSGTTLTTYYARAEAESTEGGTAAVSFESFNAATQTAVNTSYGPTKDAAPKTNIYFKAVASEDYEFVGWKLQLSDNEYVYDEANYTIQDFTYSSEDANAPSTKKLIAVFRKIALDLEPTNPEYLPELYQTITLHRTLLQGYNTLALPFATTVAELTGRTSESDWVAQLSAVTYNQHDGFTLFFEKVTNGKIKAFDPYILYLGAQVVDPSWSNINLPAATPKTIHPSSGYGAAASPDGSSTFIDWSMTSNFEAGFSMEGLYGIVNTVGGLKRGSGSSAILNAFTAYITPPSGSAGVKVQSAFTDEWGVTTYIKGLPDDGAESEACGDELYDLSGRRIDSRQQPTRGIYVRGGRRVVVK